MAVAGVPFECVLCNPATKPGKTKRIMPKTDNVEPHLDQLGLAKGSVSCRSFFFILRLDQVTST